MWNSAKGYVIIQISEGQIERFLNRLRAESIPVYDVRRIGRAVECRIFVRDFKRLRPIRRACRCRVHITGRAGLPFCLARVLERKTLLFGCAAAILAFWLLSTRIWIIPIAGCEAVPEQVIARALGEQGIYPGASKKGLVLYRIAELARLYDDRIAMIELDLDGVVCLVKVEEAVKKGEPVDRSVPTDVVAAKDGVISRIEAYNGRAQVAVGQAVQAGDLLIAGDITLEGAEETLLVHAYGNVSAYVTYQAEAATPQSYSGLAPSGNTAPYRKVFVAGIPVFETEPDFEQYTLTDVVTSAAFGTLLPVRVTTGICREQTMQTLNRTQEECIGLAKAEAERRAYEKLPKDGRIAQKQTTHVLHDGVAVGICSIAMEESIGYIKEIVS